MIPSRLNEPFRAIPAFVDGWPSILDEFTRASGSKSGGSARGSGLASDVIEFEDRYELYVDLPGVAQDRVDIEFEDEVLRIRVAEREFELSEGAKYLHRGRTHAAAEQRIRFTDASDNIEATLKDGILRVTLEKRPEKQAKKITLTAS